MDIPVFVSCPTSLSAQQNNARSTILRYLDRYNLEPRALGRVTPEATQGGRICRRARPLTGGVMIPGRPARRAGSRPG